MKSFRIYIVFFMVVSMAIGCADENRAFKPKSVLGAIKAANAKKPLVNDGKTQGAGDEKRETTQGDETKKIPTAQVTPADQKVLDVVTQVKDFTNDNGKDTRKVEIKTEVIATTDNGKLPGSAQGQAGATTASTAMNPTDEEVAYFADVEKRATAVQTILGVSVSRFPVANEKGKFYFEILSLIKINGQKETIVSRGELAAPLEGQELGILTSMNSVIIGADKKEHVIEDGVNVKAQCSAVSCTEITIKILVKMDSKVGEKVEKVFAVAGYLFHLVENTQPDKLTKMLVFNFKGSTLKDGDAKSYEEALGTVQKPIIDENGQMVAPGAGGATAQEKEALEQAQKLKSNVSDDKYLRDEHQEKILEQDKYKKNVESAGAVNPQASKTMSKYQKDYAGVDYSADKAKAIRDADIAAIESHEERGVQQRGFVTKAYEDYIANPVSNAFNKVDTTVVYWGEYIKNLFTFGSKEVKKEEVKKQEPKKEETKKEVVKPVVTQDPTATKK